MIAKLLIGLAIGYFAWRLWHGWGPLPGTPTPPPAPPMHPDEAAARRVLGVGAEAKEREIRAAHRRLVADAHPDRGGSAEATREINAARDRLLKR